VAGILEFKKRQYFRNDCLRLLRKLLANPGGTHLPEGKFGIAANATGFMGWYLFIWGLFTFFMFIASLKLTRAVQFIFLSLTVLFWMLALRDFFGWTNVWATITGFEGIVCGLSAIYTAMAEVLNEYYERVILPLG